MNSVSPKTVAAWAGCLTLVLLASLFGRPEIPIDETRYLSVAWEAWSRGDWLVMHMNGQPYHHKPPLLFWLINLGWSVFGVNGWWPRCIAPIFSLLDLLLIAEIARRLWPATAGIGRVAGWLLLSGGYWLFFSSSVMFDVMLTACSLTALLGILMAWQDGQPRGWWLAGLGLGLGLLAKGPVVFLFVLPVALLGPWWGGARASGRGWYLGLLQAFLIGAAIALLWAIPAAIKGGPEFREAIFWGQTAGRLSGELAHDRPIWFYLNFLPVVVFPLLFWRQAWNALATMLRQQEDAGRRFVLCWILPAFLVLSLAGGKQPHYILPLFPALALLLAAGLQQLGARALRTVLLPLVIAAMGGALLTAPQWARHAWFFSYVGSSWQWAGASLLLVAAGLLWLSRSGRLDVARLGMTSVLLVSLTLLLVVRPMWPAFDMTPMAQRIKPLQDQGVLIGHVSDYKDQYQFYGRLTVPLVRVQRVDIRDWFVRNPNARLIAYLKRTSHVQRVQPLAWQPYFGGAVVLLDSASAARLRPGEGSP